VARARINLDAPWLGLLRLRKHQPQDTVLIGRLGRVGSVNRRQVEAAAELAGAVLAHQVIASLGVRLGGGPTADGEDSALNIDVDVVRLEAGQLSLDDESVALLVDV
jgi:hypothetical protein